MNNLEKYNQVFMEVFNVEASALGDDFAFKTVDSWDSIAHMVLISNIEDAFDIMLDTDDILNFTSYRDGLKTLAKYDIVI